MYDYVVIGALREAVEGLEVQLDGDALAEAFRLADLLNAKLSAAVAAFDAGAMWELDGATSMTAWLRHHAGMTSSSAKSVTSTAKKLRTLPLTAGAWLDCTLSGGQVQAIVRNATPTFADHEAGVVPVLTELSVADTALAMQQWKAMLDSEPKHDQGLHLSQTLDGQWELAGSLDPLGGETVATALRLAAVDDPDVLPAKRRADALVDVCRFFLDNQSGRRGGRHRPHLNVVIDYDDLLARRGGRFVDGGLLDASSLQALACDASIHRVVTDGRSTILDYGTSTRTIPAPLWSALVLRDRHCRFEGCDPLAVVRGPPRGGLAGRRRHQPRQPGAQVQPPPPCRPPTRLVGEAQARRHPGGHRPTGPHPDDPTTGNVDRPCTTRDTFDGQSGGMFVGLAFFIAPLIVLVVAGVIAALNGPRGAWRTAAALAVVSTAVWLAYVGLYQHETPCDDRATGCPTVYGYDAPLPDEHAAGILLLVAGFAIPAIWAGWRRLVPPLTAGAALAVGPTALAWWTAPRGDNDGLWALIFWFLPILGAAAAVVVMVAERVGVARRPSRAPGPLTVATPSDRLTALAIDIVVIGGVLIVPLTALSHAKLEVVAGILGVLAGTAYLAVPLAWKGRTLGQSLVGLVVVDARTNRPVSLGRASLRGLSVVVQVAAAPTLILIVPAALELVALNTSGRTVTDRVLRTSVLSTRGAADAA